MKAFDLYKLLFIITTWSLALSIILGWMYSVARWQIRRNKYLLLRWVNDIFMGLAASLAYCIISYQTNRLEDYLRHGTWGTKDGESLYILAMIFLPLGFILFLAALVVDFIIGWIIKRRQQNITNEK